MQPIIKIENLSKMYRLGEVGTGTLSHDLKRWYYRMRGWEDPYLKIGEANVRDTKSKSDYIWALKDINLEVMPGEVLGIIGKNGAGKSTLLKILSKVTGPTTGDIHYNGRIGALLEVGTGFHQELTGRENIFLNGAVLGMNKAEIRGRLDEIVDFSGVERYIDTPVKRYSSGMMVRLGFAVAAHLDPEILVVDEVLAVGDAEFQKKAIGKMQDVSKNDGRTVLFVSHNMASIQHLCEIGIVLNNGRIINQGKINDCVTSYLNYSRQTSDTIIGGITYCHPDFQIESILANDHKSNKIEVGKENNKINIVFNGHIKEDKPISLEVRIYDNKEIPLAFFSPGHKEGKVPTIPKGKFHLSYDMVLPANMNRGSYYADIFLTYPGQHSWVVVGKGLKIITDGSPTDTGWVFEYDKGAGWLFL